MSSINKIFDVQLGEKIYDVRFHAKNDVVFSASKIYQEIAIFESRYIDGGDGFVSWNKLKVNYNKFENNNIYVYIRTSDSSSDTSQEWVGPFLQQEYDISNFKNQFIQVKIVMSCNNLNVQSPIINSINISCFKLGNAETFFTKTFDLGFKPKHIILTYNGDIPESTIIQFAIAGKETTNPNDFNIIDVNSIDDINNIKGISNKMKLMISGVGNRNIPFIIDEFALMISGDKQVLIT